MPEVNIISLIPDSVRTIEVEDISGIGSVFVQSDGEHLGFLPRKFTVLPAAIQMIC